jgi:hypothetical protein
MVVMFVGCPLLPVIGDPNIVPFLPCKHTERGALFLTPNRGWAFMTAVMITSAAMIAATTKIIASQSPSHHLRYRHIGFRMIPTPSRGSLQSAGRPGCRSRANRRQRRSRRQRRIGWRRGGSSTVWIPKKQRWRLVKKRFHFFAS